MNTNGQVITNVFNDKNINKDERYMFLMFISMIEEVKDEITISITTLMDAFQTKCKKKILGILKSLENKGYIEIIKSVGRTNKYRVIKNYLHTIVNNFDHGNKENQYSDENHYAGDFYNKNTSSNREPGNDMTSGNLDTSSNITTGNIDTGSYIEPVSNDYEKYAQHKRNSYLDEDYISLEDKRYTYDLNNNKYNNKYNNKLYINIFNAWNKININKEPHINPKITDAINTASKIYLEEQIVQAIENYSKVYHSNHYYNHPWKIVNFLSRPNGMKRFIDTGDIWLSYKDKYEDEELYGGDFDIEKYID